jgi:hypothetical protein
MDPEGPDPDGRTALIGYALASHVHADLVRLLLARGARAQAQDARGMTALHALAHNRGQLEETASVSRLLTAAGLPVDVRDHRGRTPLHWAAAPESGNRRAIPVLLDLGADVEARDADGLTPLLLAVGIPANAFPIVRYLLDRGANPRAAAPDGRTAADLVARRVAELEAQAATPDPVPGDPAQARAAAARQRMEVRMARMTLRALDGLDPRPPVAALPVDLPEPLWLGYRSRPRRGPITPGVLETAHVEEVCSYGHACWTEGVNQAACFPTPEAIPEGFQEGDDGAPAEVYAYRAFPLLFDANGETRPLTAAELLGSEVPPPKVPDLARFTRLGYDVTECANGASPWAGCSPLSPYCNGLYWGVSALINRHCLVEDLATAGDLAVAFGVSQPEPGPYLIVEVWRAAGC